MAQPQQLRDYTRYLASREQHYQLDDYTVQESYAASQQAISAHQLWSNAQDDILRHKPTWHMDPEILYREDEDVDSIFFYIQADNTWWELKELGHRPFPVHCITRQPIHFLPDDSVLTCVGYFTFNQRTYAEARETMDMYLTDTEDPVVCLRINIPRYFDLYRA
ncbi:hypothetical protein E8E14_007501 [Neopestalotiopsis sp. 37M]|nr:hypothetical protein E8E14_007501 [Neopestalotiopsis sp. 37M]